MSSSREFAFRKRRLDRRRKSILSRVNCRIRHNRQEFLEPRLMLAVDDILSVGRFLSAYSVTDVQNNELTITYSVFNQQAEPVHGTLLTATLEPGVSLKNASQLPDQNGQELAWSLGTIDPFGQVSVDVTVSFDSGIPLVLDDGAVAFGTVDARAVSDAAPAARLGASAIDASLLASTVDASTTDPFIRAKAAQLDFDPNQIFEYLRDDIGFESYVGSLRGARGTLWSEAGNALDVASLGVALMRTSGIPAEYLEGSLTFEQSQQLLGTMFPDRLQVLGEAPPAADTADPVNDYELIAEAQQHYWLQFDAGSGMQAADPLLPDAQIGQSFTTATGSFREVADELHHKVNIRLLRELATPNLLGGSPFLDLLSVLDSTENTAALVGRPLTIGQEVAVDELSTIFTTRTTTYSPYLIVAGETLDVRDDAIIRGQDFQEVLTSFPYGSQILTGVFLEMRVIAPDGSETVYSKTLADRIGLEVRRGGSGTAQIEPTGPPLMSPLDFTTINVLSGKFQENLTANYEQQLTRIDAEMQALLDRATVPENNEGVEGTALHVEGSNMLRVVSVAMARARLADFLAASDALAERQADQMGVRAYLDSPRLTLLQSKIGLDAANVLQISRAVDLIKNDMRAIAAPGQNKAAAITFQMLRGYTDTGLETAVFGSLASEVPGIATGATVSAQTIFSLAKDQGIGLTVLMAGDESQLNSLDLPATARILIGDALIAGKMVVVPSQSVEIDGRERSGWYETNVETGETIGVLDDGSHGLIDDAHTRMLWGNFVTNVGQAVMGYLAGTLTIGFANQAKSLLKSFAINHLLTQAGIPPAKAAALEGLIGAVEGTLAMVKNFEARLPAFALGYTTAVLAGLASLEKDPALAPILIGANGTAPPLTNEADSEIDQAANRTTGSVNADVQAAGTTIQGNLQANWSSAAATKSLFHSSTLNVASGTVESVGGGTVGSGVISLTGGASAALSISGAATYSLSGSGSLSFYAAATTDLGVSGNWDDYAATLSGSVTIELTTDALALNGTVLPAGTYRITTSSAALAGSGRSNTPDFAGSASILATDATIQLGPASGTFTLGGSSLPLDNGVTLSGYDGSLAVTAGVTTDQIQLTGTAVDVLQVSPSVNAVTTDQNTPQAVGIQIETSLADTYELSAVAPHGWTVEFGPGGVATVTPAAGLQGGTYAVRLIARSQTNADLIAQGEVQFTVAPTAPGVSLAVAPDTLFYVPLQGAQVPTAYQATIRNLGPATDTFDLTFSAAPPGFEIVTSADSLTIPAGQTAIVGIYLRPVAALAAPGTPLSFTVTATSGTNAAITESQVVSFTMPEVHGVTLNADPTSVSLAPGTSQQISLQLKSVGNVPEDVAFTVQVPDGLTLGGLTDQTLAAGESRTVAVTISALPGAQLNSLLNIDLVAAFGGTEPLHLMLPIRVVAPGVEAIANAAAAAASAGNVELSDRLDDLAIALTNLTQEPSSEIFKSQAVAALDAVIRIAEGDSLLRALSDDLAAPRAALANATTEAEILAALNQLDTALDDFGSTISAVANSNFEVFLLPNTQVAQPGTPVQFGISLHNIGLQTSTYHVSLGTLPAGVTGSISESTVTLDRDEFTTNLFVTITPPANELAPFDFQVSVAVDGAPQVTKMITGALTARDEFLSVVDVEPSSLVVNPGDSLDVTARLLNVVNRTQTVLIRYDLVDSDGQTVLAATPFGYQLNVQSSLLTAPLVTTQVPNLPHGQYTIVVHVTDNSGNPLPGGTGQGTLFVGSPVTATLTTAPDIVPPGSSTITNTLQIDTTTFDSSSPFVVGHADVAGATDVVRQGSYAYVTGTAGLSVFDVSGSNIDNPVFVRTVGGAAANIVRAQGDKLYTLRATTTNFTLSIYSLADPANPTLLGATAPIPYAYAINMVFAGDHVYVINFNTIFLLSNGDIFDHNGSVVSIDVSDPANPVVDGDAVSASGTPAGRDGVNDGVLFNEFGTSNDGVQLIGGIDQSGGSHNTWDGVQLDATTLLVTGSTATGTDTQTGSAIVHVVDISDPQNPTVVRDLTIPGAVQAFSITVDGNQAMVVGSTGGFLDFANSDNGGFTGTIFLASLDITDHRNPALVHVETTALPSRVITFHEPLGNGRFAIGLGETSAAANDAKLVVIDASNPDDPNISSITVPANISRLTTDNGLIYVADPTGMTIYDPNDHSTIPIVASVQIPNNSGVAVVPGSFNVPPTRIEAGSDFDTLVWEDNLTSADTSRQFTWQSTITGMLPGATRDVTLDTNIEYTLGGGTLRELTLPPQRVASRQVLSLNPTERYGSSGQELQYTLTIENPTSQAVSYDLAVEGIPDEWVDLAPSINVPAEGSAQVTLKITSDPFEPFANHQFFVTATTGGVTSSVQGTLGLLGPFVPPPDPLAHGVVVSLNPEVATAGQGTAVQYLARVINTGSANDVFVLDVSGLPPEFTVLYDQVVYDLPPGAENYRDVAITVTPPVGTSVGQYPFTVMAYSAIDASIASQATGLLNVVAAGVDANIIQDTGLPQSTLRVTVTNTGNASDTFALSLAGPVAVFAALSTPSVTLGPGESQDVDIVVGDIDFSLPGALSLVAVARSLTDASVFDSDSAAITIDGLLDMSAAFEDDSIELPAPGPGSFLLLVDNIGNLEDQYAVEIVGTTGPVTASLRGLRGTPSASIPIFVLPGLSTGAIVLDSQLTGLGTGTVTLRVKSLTDSNIVTETTASISALSTTQDTTTTVSVTDGTTYGDLFTFQAIVSAGIGTPDGFVQFQIDGVNVGSPVALSGGTASLITTATLPVDQYSITAIYAGNTAFTGSEGTTLLDVSPAELLVTAEDKSKVYGADLPTLTVTYAGFVNGDGPDDLDTPPAIATTATVASNVGEYPITASGAASANYTIAYATGKLAVTPATLTITADDKTKVQNAPLPVLTASYSGLVNGDTPASLDTPPTLSTAATATSPPGDYAIIASGAADTNYNIAFVNGNLHVNPAPTEGADVRLTSTSTPGSVLVGKTTDVTYSFTVKNVGKLTATDLVISLAGVLPQGVSVKSIKAPSGTSFSGSAENGVWTISSLRKSKSTTLCITLRVDSATTPGRNVIQLTAAAVSADQALIHPENDSTTQTTSVTTSADLAIVRHTATSSISRGGTITYRITITNKGPGVASNVVLTDVLPTGVTFVSQAQDCGPTFDLSDTDSGVTNTIDQLACGESATFIILAHVENSVKKGQKLVNKVTVSGDSSDPSSRNNTSTATTRVNGTTRPPCQNPGSYAYAHKDVDANGLIEPNDVLLLLDRIQRFGIGELPSDLNGDPYFDVDGDNAISPADVLQVLDHINLTIDDFASGYLSSVETSELPSSGNQQAAESKARLVETPGMADPTSIAVGLTFGGAAPSSGGHTASGRRMPMAVPETTSQPTVSPRLTAVLHDRVFGDAADEDWLTDDTDSPTDRDTECYDFDELDLLALR